MRLAVLAFAAMLTLTGVAAAQTSPPFTINKEYRFAAIFPGAPTFADITYTNSSGDRFPARRFSVVQDNNIHAITVVDAAKGQDIDLNLVEHATEDLRKRGTVRTQEYEDYCPGVPGRQLEIMEPDGRQLRASVYMWDHRLFITEAEGTPGSISLLQFEQSVTILNADGTSVNF